MQHKTILAFISHQDTIGRLEDIAGTIRADFMYFDLSKLALHNFSNTEDCNLLLIETSSDSDVDIEQAQSKFAEVANSPIFLIADEKSITSLKLAKGVKSDFASEEATDAEIRVRLNNLLWNESGEADGEVIHIGKMSVNLSTYQVLVEGEPLDLTYLEYKLLIYLIERQGKTFSREELLKDVWGFEYYGGSRTVDVHIRRLRAKLGPECSEHLKTVRGVGYYWSID